MKKSMKNIMAGLLSLSILLSGVMALATPLVAGAYTAPDGPPYNRADCDALNDDGTLRFNTIGAPIDFVSFCSNNGGGNSCLFGKVDGKDCVLTVVINVALYFIGSISVLMLIIGGVRYTMSAGNEKAVGAAKSTILYAVIGVVVALLAYAIVNFVLTTFKA